METMNIDDYNILPKKDVDIDYSEIITGYKRRTHDNVKVGDICAYLEAERIESPLKISWTMKLCKII